MSDFEKDLKESLNKITLLQQEIKDLAFNYQIKKEADKLVFESLENNVLKDVCIEEYLDQGLLFKIKVIRFRLNGEDVKINVRISLVDEINNNVFRKISETISEHLFKIIANKI